MMHGDGKRGNLGFEDCNDHTKIFWFIKKEFIEELLKKHNHPYSLIYFASCYSSYGDLNESSLTFLTINSGLSQYAIGFNGSMGSEKTLPTFAETFYTHFFKGDSIEEAFYKAVLKLKTDNNTYWYKPTLYKTVTA